MGKNVDQSEYQKAKHQLKSCKAAKCPNAGAEITDEESEFCGPCKGARRTARDFERANPLASAPLPERRK